MDRERRERGAAPVAVAVALGALLWAGPASAQSVPGVGVQVAPAEPDAGSEREERSLVLGAGLGFGVLNLPKLGVAASLLAHLRPSGFVPIELQAMYWFDNEDELTLGERDLRIHPLVGLAFPPGGTRTAFRAAELRAALCPFAHELRSGLLMACGGVSGGVLLARSEGLLDSADQTRPLFAFEAYARWHFNLVERMGLIYSVGFFVPVFRERFGYVNSLGRFEEQFRITPVAGRFDVGLSYAF